MNISKTTINFAKKKLVELCVDEDSVSFYPLNDEGVEPALIYSIQDTGFFFKSNIWLSDQTKEDLPHWVMDEKMLRRMIDFIAPELNSTH
ncbi:hypothetical protein AB4218_23210 [Vibrio splendidus]